MEKLGKSNFALKEQQCQVLEARSDSDSQHAVIFVVFPLNALMQDQVEKLMAYANVCIMKASTDLTDLISDWVFSPQAGTFTVMGFTDVPRVEYQILLLWC